MNIPLCIPSISDAELDLAREALTSGWLAHGPFNHKFEHAFAEYLGVKHAITLNSCTSALFLALKAQDISGEVILPSFTFVASANAVVTAGAVPVLVDIDYDTCNILPAAIEAAITPRTEAIMPVHFAGQPCLMDAISEIASRHGLALIEDSAETLGATFAGRQAGTFGAGCFSFFPTKNLTTGEGGMLTTDNGALAARVRVLASHGVPKTTYEREKEALPWYRSAVEPGYNFRLSNVLAAVGYAQMGRLDAMNARRQQLAAAYSARLADIEAIALPVVHPQATHVYQMYTVKLKQGDRDRFVQELRKLGVGASVHFDPPVHHSLWYRQQSHPHDLSVTECVAARIVTLPMYPDMTEGEVDFVCDCILSVLGNG